MFSIQVHINIEFDDIVEISFSENEDWISPSEYFFSKWKFNSSECKSIMRMIPQIGNWMSRNRMNTNTLFTLPFMPWCDEFVTYCQNFDFKIRRDHQKKNPYERRDYELVDEKSLS